MEIQSEESEGKAAKSFKELDQETIDKIWLQLEFKIKDKIDQ